MRTVRVRYFGGTRAAAGVTEEVQQAETLGELLDRVGDLHGPALRAALAACSFLVDGTQWRDHGARLPPAATVDVLPPFAGG
ncbi:MoaD/ThiS family protein [Micromonospora sp. CPCC 206060]|uniref:MoaD/ThiS family protein n=1 Tax=Micromonospora sp. CPCC 206060 TaxID=3122406 RepID=UPI002FF40824